MFRPRIFWRWATYSPKTRKSTENPGSGRASARWLRLSSFRSKITLPALFPGIYPRFLPRFCKTNPTRILLNSFITRHIRIFQLGSFRKNTLFWKVPCQPTSKPSRRERRSRVGRDAVAANAVPRSGKTEAEPSGSEQVQLSHTPPSSQLLFQSRVRQDATTSCRGRRTVSYTTPVLSKNWRNYITPRPTASSNNIDFR